MPMYDFECTKCGQTFEMVTPSSAAPPPCPECHEPSERLMSAPLLGKSSKMSAIPEKGKKYLSKEYQTKLKAKAAREGRRWGPPK